MARTVDFSDLIDAATSGDFTTAQFTKAFKNWDELPAKVKTAIKKIAKSGEMSAVNQIKFIDASDEAIATIKNLRIKAQDHIVANFKKEVSAAAANIASFSELSEVFFKAAMRFLDEVTAKKLLKGDVLSEAQKKSLARKFGLEVPTAKATRASKAEETKPARGRRSSQADDEEEETKPARGRRGAKAEEAKPARGRKAREEELDLDEEEGEEFNALELLTDAFIGDEEFDNDQIKAIFKAAKSGEYDSAVEELAGELDKASKKKFLALFAALTGAAKVSEARAAIEEFAEFLGENFTPAEDEDEDLDEDLGDDEDDLDEDDSDDLGDDEDDLDEDDSDDLDDEDGDDLDEDDSDDLDEDDSDDEDFDDEDEDDVDFDDEDTRKPRRGGKTQSSASARSKTVSRPAANKSTRRR